LIPRLTILERTKLVISARSMRSACPSRASFTSSYKDTDNLNNLTTTTFEQVTYISILWSILRAINADRDLAGGGAQFLVQAAVSANPHVVLGDPHLSIKSTASV